ncbi:MAG: hypothetical protein ACRDGS_13525, partial [Chloroflexota bacterium]
ESGSDRPRRLVRAYGLPQGVRDGDPMSFDPYNDPSFWQEVQAESETRRAHPREFAAEALESIFADASDEEALGAWRRKVAQFPWWAEDALYCIDAILAADEPLDTIAVEARLPVRSQTVRDWLAARIQPLHAAFDEVVREQSRKKDGGRGGY